MNGDNVRRAKEAIDAIRDGSMGLRLVQGGRKGLSRLLFSRTALIAALILGQLLIFVALYSWFRDSFPYYTAFETAFTVGMVLYLCSNDMDSTAKLTWMALIALFPLPGAAFLLFTQAETGHRGLRRRYDQLTEETRESLSQNPETLEKLEAARGGVEDLHRYINRTGCFPLYENPVVQYFPTGEEKFASMLQELQTAEKFIFLEYFIVKEGEMWGRILEILAEKAAQGVDVRVMYDGTCEISLLPHDYPERLKKLGIQCRIFSPLRPFVSTYFNYRDHRKILVIDGKTAYTGGVNLGDEYINRASRFGHWKDAAILVRGGAVRSFTRMFLQMWHLPELDTTEDLSPFLNAPASPDEGEGCILPYGDCPLDPDKVGERVYMDILNRATDYVHIMTPYLILDGELETALRYAAERGVDVELILPGIPDKKSAYSLAKTHYSALIRSGVKIFEYTPGFVHSKVVVSDGERGVVGTVNFDYRSLYHHFECAAYLYRTPCLRDMETDFLATRNLCRAVTPQTIRREKLYYKVLGRVLKLFAPLM